MMRLDGYEGIDVCGLCGSQSNTFVLATVPFDIEVVSSDYLVINNIGTFVQCWVCSVCIFGLGATRMQGQMVFDNYYALAGENDDTGL